MLRKQMQKPHKKKFCFVEARLKNVHLNVKNVNVNIKEHAFFHYFHEN